MGLLYDRKALAYRELSRKLKYYADRLKTIFNPNTITRYIEKSLIKAVPDELRVITKLSKPIEIHDMLIFLL